MKALQILRTVVAAVAVLALAMESNSARAQIVNSPGQANIGGVGPQTMGLGGNAATPARRHRQSVPEQSLSAF